MSTLLTNTSDDERVASNECVSTDTARDILTDTLRTALSGGENTLIEAPTSLGKTYHIATTSWRDYPEITGGEPVIHLHQTREARDQAANESQKAEIEHTILKSREERCPVARGDYDDEYTAPDGGSLSDWFERKCDEQGYEFSYAHSHLNEEFDGLPCQHDGECGGTEQWADVPRNDDGESGYDIIHATHKFARVEPLIEDANVIIDERPDYGEKIGQEDLQRAMNSLLERHAPEQRLRWPKLVTAIADQDEGRIAEYRNLIDQLPDEREPLANRDTHRLAPTILRALVSAEPEIKNRFVGTDGRTTVVVKDNGNVPVVRRQPAFSEARCVVGLDAHPSKLLWEQNIGTDLRHTEVLEPRERGAWRQSERGLSVIQIGKYTRSFTTGWWNDSNQHLKAKAIIQKVRRKYGDAFRTCIAPLRIKDGINKMMIEENIDNPEIMHYGEQNSRNDFADESVGLLLGCIDPSDDFVLDMLAEQGLEARPKMVDTEDGEERAVGREFVGPDADAAQEFLESVREENVAQAIGRYARDAENSERVTVYAWTDVIPDHMIDGKTPGVTTEITDKKLAMLHVVDEQGPVTTRMVADQVDSGKEHIRQTFNRMVEQDILTISEGTGTYGANEYETTGEDLLPMVDLDMKE